MPRHPAFALSLPLRTSHRPRPQSRRRPRACATSVNVKFTPEDISVRAKVGECLAVVAARARVDVLVNCNIGDCGSCEIELVSANGDKRIVRACVAAIPEAEEGTDGTVTYLTYPDDIW